LLALSLPILSINHNFFAALLYLTLARFLSISSSLSYRRLRKLRKTSHHTSLTSELSCLHQTHESCRPIPSRPLTPSFTTNMAEATTSAHFIDDFETRNNPDGAPQIHSIHTLFLEKPPCCLEFSPIARDYFIVGTYNLVDDAKEAEEAGEEMRKVQQRDGSLILCRIDGEKM
jgi:hypothetical protein